MSSTARARNPDPESTMTVTVGVRTACTLSNGMSNSMANQHPPDSTSGWPLIAARASWAAVHSVGSVGPDQVVYMCSKG